tara:strand:+ start:18090 stop:19121 length:1032 start_codon:yes stop_codon:yes gene_type:complete
MSFDKSILIFCEASSEIGLGHLIRCFELFKEFKNLTNHKIHFFSISKEETFKKLARSKDINSLVDCTFFDRSTDQQIIEYISTLSLDLVLFDTYFEHRELREYFSKQKCPSISLDYFYKDNLPDIVINLFNHNPVLQEGLKHKTKVLSGGKYAIIRDEFKTISRERGQLSIKEDIARCLIVMGGSDPSCNTVKAISLIQNTFLAKELPLIDIVVGPLFDSRLKQQIDIVSKDELKKYKIHNSPKYLEKLFLNTDLVFCGGGTTLLESMSLGIPTIVLPQSQEEKNHAAHYAKKDCCFLVDNNDEVSNLLNYSYRSQLSENSKKEIDFNGKERIINLANKLLDE